MQQKVATFEKVSLEEFSKTMRELFPKYVFKNEQLEIMHREIPMPRRSTEGSAGYDFFAPFEFVLRPGTAIMIPTGIRVKFVDVEDPEDNPDWALVFLPKSGIGTKTSIHLSNTLGLIDCDYYFSDNEGHIMIKMEMPCDNPTPVATATTKFGTSLDITRKAAKFAEHSKFVQGVFIKFGITTDDDKYDKEERNGGFGSTGNIITNNKPVDAGATSGDPFTDENAEEITEDDLINLLNS